MYLEVHRIYIFALLPGIDAKVLVRVTAGQERLELPHNVPCHFQPVPTDSPHGMA